MTVLTYGNRCFSAADTEVRIAAQEAVVTPYDRDPGCPERDLKQIEHSATVRFTEAGDYRILVRGIDASTRSSINLVGDTVVVVRTVTIR